MSLILNNLRAGLRFVGLIVALLLCLLFVSLVYSLGMEKWRARVALWCYGAFRWLFGLRMHVSGTIAPDRPLLIIPNHTSYLDIIGLGSLIGLSFTPKSEIRRWPIIGWMCVLSDCVFIERRPAFMKQGAALMKEKLARGKVLCIFGEGTTTDGINIKPFKSGFFSLAIEENLPVQPVSVAYTHFGDRPILLTNREEIAWIGEATLLGHMWHILSKPNVQVYVQAHPVIPAGTYTDRKLLAKACEQAVKQGVAALLEEHCAKPAH